MTGASKYTKPRAGGAPYNALPNPAMTSQPPFLFYFVTDQLNPSPRRDLRPSLPGLTANMLTRVLHAFALIRLWRSEASDLRSHRSDLLLVRTGNRQQILTLHRYLNPVRQGDRKSTRLNSSHHSISYTVFCLKKKKKIK